MRQNSLYSQFPILIGFCWTDKDADNTAGDTAEPTKKWWKVFCLTALRLYAQQPDDYNDGEALTDLNANDWGKVACLTFTDTYHCYKNC